MGRRTLAASGAMLAVGLPATIALAGPCSDEIAPPPQDPRGPGMGARP
ncbi:MAG: hypothetical protein JWQ36_2773 [Enterovirga sp.]|nr:hypothetical protein [Enterovirga sp.]